MFDKLSVRERELAERAYDQYTIEELNDHMKRPNHKLMDRHELMDWMTALYAAIEEKEADLHRLSAAEWYASYNAAIEENEAS